MHISSSPFWYRPMTLSCKHNVQLCSYFFGFRVFFRVCHFLNLAAKKKWRGPSPNSPTPIQILLIFPGKFSLFRHPLSSACISFSLVAFYLLQLLPVAPLIVFLVLLLLIPRLFCCRRRTKIFVLLDVHSP